MIVATADIPVPDCLDRDGPVLEDDIVQVSGIVQASAGVDVEEDLIVDLDDELFAEFDGEPAIAAENVRLTLRLSDVPAGAVTVEAAEENEDTFDGQEVTMNGEVVELIGG